MGKYAAKFFPVSDAAATPLNHQETINEPDQNVPRTSSRKIESDLIYLINNKKDHPVPNFVHNLIIHPKRLFLLDGFGAFLTAFILFAISRRFNEYVGIPQTTLGLLSLIALIFAVYSISCFFLVSDNWQPFLKIISIANLLYCCLTIGVVIYYNQSLKVPGLVYFLAEIVVVCTIVFVEMKTLVRRTKE